MEELERERAAKPGRPHRDPELLRALESLRLARTELEQQLAATANERRKAQIRQALEEIDRRINETSARIDDGKAAVSRLPKP